MTKKCLEMKFIVSKGHFMFVGYGVLLLAVVLVVVMKEASVRAQNF